jgi:lipopolysaccharide export system protein LptC
LSERPHIGERLSAWFPLLLLAVLAGLTFWLDRIVQPPASPRTEHPKSDPDYVVDGLSAVRMDSQGRTRDTLRALKMTHYPADDSTVLLEPRFISYAENHSPVTVTSRRARVSSNGENVYFEEGVRVVRAPYANRSELVLETSYLHVIPDANLAKTDKPVVIRDASAVIAASGLELNGETRVLNLQGRVRSTYDPPKAAQHNAR